MKYSLVEKWTATSRFTRTLSRTIESFTLEKALKSRIVYCIYACLVFWVIDFKGIIWFQRRNTYYDLEKNNQTKTNKLYFHKKILSFSSSNQFILIQIRKTTTVLLKGFWNCLKYIFSILHYKLGIKHGFCKGKKVKRKLY